MKKSLLSLGSITSIVTPIAVVVSCGKNDVINNKAYISIDFPTQSDGSLGIQLKVDPNTLGRSTTSPTYYLLAQITIDQVLPIIKQKINSGTYPKLRFMINNFTPYDITSFDTDQKIINALKHHLN